MKLKLNGHSRSVMPRGICPHCGKRGLGNIRLAQHTWEPDHRDCRYCGEIVIVGSPTRGYEHERERRI